MFCTVSAGNWPLSESCFLEYFLAAYRDWHCYMGLQLQDERGSTAAAATKDAFLGVAVLVL